METDNNKNVVSKKIEETGKFTRDLLWITLSQVVGSFILGIVTLPALTKNYSLELFGVWSQAFITVGLLSPIFCLELDMAVVRFLAPEDDKNRIRKALGSILMPILAVCIIAYITVSLLAPHLAYLIFGNVKYANFIPLTFLWVIASAIFTFFSAYLRAKKRMKILSIRSLILSIVVMVLVIILSSQGISLEWVIRSVVAAYAVMAAIFFVMIVREVGWPTPNVVGLKNYLSFSLPQIPGIVLLWLMSSSDRYFITHFLGLSQAGIYQSSYQLAAVVRMFYSPIVFVLYPTLSRLWDEKRFVEVKNYLQHSTRLLLTLGIPAAVGIALLSQPLLGLLTTREFLAGENLVFLISIGTVLLGINQINGQIILLEKRTRVLPLITVIASVVSVGMNTILIPRIGILGAGISNIVSYFVLALIVTIWVYRTISYKFDFQYVAKVVAATVPMAACIYFLRVDSIGGIFWGVISGILVFVAGLYVLRAFSEKDKRLIRGMLVRLVPGNTYKKPD
jgi:O-antigen/teichoic acid export membrane protein